MHLPVSCAVFRKVASAYQVKHHIRRLYIHQWKWLINHVPEGEFHGLEGLPFDHSLFSE